MLTGVDGGRERLGVGKKKKSLFPFYSSYVTAVSE